MALRSINTTLLLIIAGSNYAQTPFSYHLTVADGLPSNKVYSIAQDHKGFMWFGTDNGVVRYDGTRMVKYTVTDGLPDNDAFSVFEDHENRLWILCFKQAPCFFHNNKLHTIHNDTFLRSHFESNVSYKFAISWTLKRILFYTGEGVFTKLIEYGKVTQLPLSANTVNNHFFQLFTSGNTDFLFANYSVLNLGKMRKQSFHLRWYQTGVEQFKKNGEDVAIINNPTRYTLSFAVKSADSLREIKFLKVPLMYGPYKHNNQIYFIDSGGRILNLDTQNLNLIATNRIVPDTRVSDAYIDRAGNFWVGTLVNGLYMIPSHSAEIYETGIDKSPTCIFPYRNKIYVGTENRHIFVLDPPKPIKQFDVKILSFRTLRVSGLCARGNDLFVGGDFKLGKWDLVTGEYTTYNRYLAMLQSIKDLEVNHKGEILIACTLGAGIFSPELENISDTFWMERTTALQTDLSDNYLLGTLNGLYRMHSTNGVIKKWNTGTALDKSRITDIKIDSKNRIWIGTAQYGLFIANGNKIQQFNDAKTADLSQRLTSYYVRNIFFDTRGIAWVSTDKGLNRIENLKNGKFKVQRITKAIGLPDDNLNAAYVTNDTVYLASTSGLMRFVYSNSLFAEQLGCEITGAWVNFKPISTDTVLSLPYNQNNVSIEFAGIAFRSASNLGYQYRLLGSDSAWTVTENNRIDLMSVLPGTYRFEVMAINLITGQTSQVRIFEFTIQQAWYKSTPFILAALLLAASAIALIIYLRIKRLKKESENKLTVTKKMAELEMQALRAQMNPHFIFNALTAIQNFYVNQKEKEGNLYMSRFARLIRQSLDLSKDNMIRLDEEIQFLENYMELELMRFQGKLQYECSVAPGVDADNVFIPTMMLQPILENAVNHGIRPSEKQGLVQLSFFMQDEQLVCQIKDNGIGINKSEETKRNGYSSHKSKGIFILKSRIQSIEAILQTRIGYEIEDISETDNTETGTVVRIYFGENIFNEQTI